MSACKYCGGATSYSCTNNTWALNSEALSQIDEVTYYLGGTNVQSSKVSDWYNAERGTTVCNANRSTSWNGYVGLMYSLDYGYTFANGVDDTCYANVNNCYTGSLGVPSSSWLYVASSSSWIISQYSGNVDSSFRVSSDGRVYCGSVSSSSGIRPVVHLKQSTKLDGTGTKSNPYIIIT